MLEIPSLIPGIGKEISVSEHAFLCVICRDDMKKMRHPVGQDVNWLPIVQRRSSPVQVKEPYRNLKWLCVGLHLATQSVQCTVVCESSKEVKMNMCWKKESSKG